MKKANLGDRPSGKNCSADVKSAINSGAGAAGAGAKEVDEYLARVPEPARTTLNTIRATIRSLVPAEATECISYGIPGFRYKGRLVWYAGFKEHCSFFPGNAGLIQTFKDDLKGYPTSKGTIRFPVDKPLPAHLLKKIVKARIAENDAKKKS